MAEADPGHTPVVWRNHWNPSSQLLGYPGCPRSPPKCPPAVVGRPRRAEFDHLLCADTTNGLYIEAAEVVARRGAVACKGHLLRQRLTAIRSRLTERRALWGRESEPFGEARGKSGDPVR